MKLLPALVPSALLFLCACSGSSSSVSSIPVVEVEPNDSVASAGKLALGGTARGSLSVIGDDDWWSVDLDAGDVLSIEVAAQRFDQPAWTTNGNSARVGLYAPDGVTRLLLQGSVPFAWTAGQDTDVFAYRVATSGRHYLKLEAEGGAAQGGAYLLSVRRRDMGAMQFELEPIGTSGGNDTSGTAEPLTAAVVHGWHVDDEADFYSFQVTEPSRVSLTIAAHRNGLVGAETAVYDPELRLLDAGLNLLADSDDVYYLDSAIEYLLESSGTYYVEVSECCEDGDAPYFLSFELEPLRAPLVVVPESEPNDSRATAQAIGFDQLVEGDLAVGADDYYAFACNAGDRIQVELYDEDGLQSATLPIDLVLQDGTGATVSSASGSELDLQRTILSAGGTYFVHLSQPLGSGSSTYALRVTQLPSGYEVEPNNNLPQATPLDVQGRAAGVIGGTIDTDYFSFQAVAGVPVAIDCLADGAPSTNGFGQHNDFGSLMSPILSVRTASGAVLATADCDLGVLNGVIEGLPTATLVFLPPTTGTYFLEVNDTTGGAGPDFRYAIVRR